MTLFLDEDLSSAVAALRTARMPEVAHETFRAVLDALARPGTRHRLPCRSRGEVPAVLLPVLALADLGVGVHVAGEPAWAARWARPLATATDATTTKADHARLLVLGPGAEDGLLEVARHGSAEAPEDAALVICAVQDGLDGGAPCLLSGPGVDGVRRIAPRGMPTGWRVLRDTARYPTGVDLLLVDDQGVVALPRSTRATTPDPTATTDEEVH